MKTKEEMSALKEAETMDNKLHVPSDEELAKISGGDIDINFDFIMQYIESGNDYLAREYFKLAQYRLAPLEAHTIRMTFWAKFGYPID